MCCLLGKLAQGGCTHIRHGTRGAWQSNWVYGSRKCGVDCHCHRRTGKESEKQQRAGTTRPSRATRPRTLRPQRSSCSIKPQATTVPKLCPNSTANRQTSLALLSLLAVSTRDAPQNQGPCSRNSTEQWEFQVLLQEYVERKGHQASGDYFPTRMKAQMGVSSLFLALAQG